MKNSCILFLVVLLFSCNSSQEVKKKSDAETAATSEKIKYSSDLSFPKVDSLSHFPNTDFVFTLNQDLPQDKNVIYALTIAYCWDEIKNQLSGELTIENQFTLLKLINEFKNFKNVLQKGEYETKVDYNKELGLITAKAYFKKALPFSTPLIKFPKKELFNTDMVTYFGAKYHFHDFERILKILFYSSKEFALKLQPIDPDHEIILYCPEKSDFKNFEIAFSRLNEIQKEFTDSYTRENAWKHYFTSDDEVKIPIISFNLETRIKELEGSAFFVREFPWKITYAYQRNAFVLNENGAIVESEADMEAEVEEVAEEELPQPKLFHFNKPFYIFLKRKDAEYPYFAVLINNSELMPK